MRFEWDPRKQAANLRKHGIDFADGHELFSGETPFLVAADMEGEFPEERWRGIGTIRGRVVVAIFSEPRAGTIRFISLRKASRVEREAYEQAIKDELESN